MNPLYVITFQRKDGEPENLSKTNFNLPYCLYTRFYSCFEISTANADNILLDVSTFANAVNDWLGSKKLRFNVCLYTDLVYAQSEAARIKNSVEKSELYKDYIFVVRTLEEVHSYIVNYKHP